MMIAYIHEKKGSSLFETIKKTDLSKFTHAVILPESSELNKNYEDVINVYYKDEAIMLPLVVLSTDKMTGLLNTCIWNTNLAVEPGVLDFELAQKQIDLTLYGALIPVKYLIEENFNKEIKYYEHFYFLNKVTKAEVEILGVPKTLLSTSIDLSYSDVDNEEKIKNFKMAKEV